jgi:hypothetical protein
MRLTSFRVLPFLGLVLSLTLAAADTAVPPAKPATPYHDLSLDKFVADAKQAAATGSTELKQVVAQLEALQEKRRTLLTSRRAKEAELARLQAAAGDASRIAALGEEIDASRSQLNVINTQFQLLVLRIQALQNPGKQPAGPAFAAAAPGHLARAVAPEQIKAAATRLLANPTLAVADARAAAGQLLAAGPAGYTSFDVEHLAQLVLQQASRDNATALRAALDAAPPGAAPAKDGLALEPTAAAAADRKHIQELRIRQVRLEMALIDLARNPPAANQAKSTKPQK